MKTPKWHARDGSWNGGFNASRLFIAQIFTLKPAYYHGHATRKGSVPPIQQYQAD